MSIIEKINDSTRNVHDLYFDLKNGKIFVDNSFQRRYVWEEKHQAALIETILLGYDIPPIYLWEQVPDDNGLIKLSVVDGQQRIGAIQAYIDGVFSLKKKYLSVEEGFDWIGKSFDELSKTDKDIIWKYKFKTREIDSDVSIDEIKTIFLRLNITNKVLNPQELRNARYNGEFIKLALELADIPFWKKHNIFFAISYRSGYVSIKDIYLSSPDCFNPISSPAPRSFKSSSAILKPSVVLHITFKRGLSSSSLNNTQ